MRVRPGVCLMLDSSSIGSWT